MRGYLHKADLGTPRKAWPVQEEKGQAAVSPCQAPQAPSALSGSQLWTLLKHIRGKQAEKWTRDRENVSKESLMETLVV